MVRVPTPSLAGAPWSGRTRARGRLAAGRLQAARRGFDLSMVALRKAALDHIDCQLCVSTSLRATLDRLAANGGVAA